MFVTGCVGPLHRQHLGSQTDACEAQLRTGERNGTFEVVPWPAVSKYGHFMACVTTHGLLTRQGAIPSVATEFPSLQFRTSYSNFSVNEGAFLLSLSSPIDSYQIQTNDYYLPVSKSIWLYPSMWAMNVLPLALWPPFKSFSPHASVSTQPPDSIPSIVHFPTLCRISRSVEKPIAAVILRT